MTTALTVSTPSTRLGSLLGHGVISAARLADYWTPLAGIRVYQLIPAATRGSLFGGPSGSHQVAAAIRTEGGSGWAIMARWMVSNHPPR